MTMFLAVYDPAYQAPDGSYWTWHHPLLSAQLLAQVYYDCLCHDLPADPSTVSPDDIWAGMTDLVEWRCYYRLLHGGRDRRGRPGRYVIVCGFIRHEEVNKHSPEPLFQGQWIESLTTRVLKECPLECSLHEVSTPRTDGFAAGDLLDQFEHSGHVRGESEPRQRLYVALGRMPVHHGRTVRVRGDSKAVDCHLIQPHAGSHRGFELSGPNNLSLGLPRGSSEWDREHTSPRDTLSSGKRLPVRRRFVRVAIGLALLSGLILLWTYARRLLPPPP